MKFIFSSKSSRIIRDSIFKFSLSNLKVSFSRSLKSKYPNSFFKLKYFSSTFLKNFDINSVNELAGCGEPKKTYGCNFFISETTWEN